MIPPAAAARVAHVIRCIALTSRYRHSRTHVTALLADSGLRTSASYRYAISAPTNSQMGCLHSPHAEAKRLFIFFEKFIGFRKSKANDKIAIPELGSQALPIPGQIFGCRPRGVSALPQTEKYDCSPIRITAFFHERKVYVRKTTSLSSRLA